MANSYYAAWFRYAYSHKIEQIMRPEEHLRFVLSDLDEAIALPSFQKACLRFIRAGQDEWTGKYLDIRRDVPVRIQDGSAVILDYCEMDAYSSGIYIFPHSLTVRYTKDEPQSILRAVKEYAALRETEITIFGPERFSDWCVHESAKREYLHKVTMDRLRF